MMTQSYTQTEKPQTAIIEKSEKLYRVKLLDRCKKDYLKLIKKNKVLEIQVENYIEELAKMPYIGEKLTANFPGCRSIHFHSNSYRIVYRVIDEPELEVLILDIGHRSKSYTDLARIIGQGK